MRERQATHTALAEGFCREKLRVVGAVNERIGIGAPLIRFGQGSLMRQRPQYACRPVRRKAEGATIADRRIGFLWVGCTRIHRDKYATSQSRLDESFIRQLLISCSDRIAAQAK